ncbi:hypothetical protein HGRIS_002091 [Hohenbuehelia grisea]|uniref:F-box domain-containing protein n=1 Tax=Hohenbuehelia grisea TaxID=104357 RepID=A0ABR3JJE0_9AGAR
MATLPAEIWMEIARYIPRIELKRLYAVNRVFFRLAMEMRYSHIHIKYLTIVDARMLSCLRNDHMANLVQSFTICDAAVWSLASLTRQQAQFQPKPFTPRALSILLQRLRLLLRRSSYKLAPKSQTKAISRSNNGQGAPATAPLEAPNIIWPGFRLFWPNLGTNLRILNLEATVDELPRLLKRSSIPSCIEDLSIRLVPWPYTRRMKVIRLAKPESMTSVIPSLLSLINRQRSLRALSLKIQRSSDFSPFFAALDHFPLLEKLILAIARLDDVSGLRRFLNSHGKTIRELSISSYLVDRLDTENIFSIVKHPRNDLPEAIILPNLTTFELDLSESYWPWNTQAITKTLPLFTQVQSFRITARRLQDHEIDELCAAFKATIRTTPIQCLAISVWDLNKALIDLLAESIPSLKSLSICVYRERGVSTFTTDTFAKEMRRSGASYPTWMLSDITITTTQETGDQRPYEYNAMRALAQCVPSIQSFHGSTLGLIPEPSRIFHYPHDFFF